MYFVSYTTTRENTKTRLNAENMPKSNAIHNVKLHQKQEAVVNLQLHCARPALSQYCKIFKGLQRDEKIAKFTSTYNKRERMATNKRRKADTCQKTAKTSKRTNQKNTKSLTFETTSNAPLAPLHRLHKTQFNTISTETVAAETVKQQSNFTTSKQSYTKPAPLAITTPHTPLPHLHRLHKTQFNTISTETITTKPVKQQANFTTSKQSCTKPAPLA